MVAAKKDTKDSSAELKALKSELEKTRKVLAEALEQIEELKEKETGKPASQPKEKTIKDGHEYVDLGLPSGLKWATCNVGASKPEDFGNYYAWGETSTKTEYMEDNSKTYGKSMLDIAGNANYDAARANWGGKWRLPTNSEMKELIKKCTWEWTDQNGVEGYKVIGPNGNSIFLPAAGGWSESSLYSVGSRGDYWCSTPEEDDTRFAYVLDLRSYECSMNTSLRNFGSSVRPVLAADVKDLKAELEKTRKALAEALEQIEKLKEKETGNPAAQPKEKTIKDEHEYVDLGLPSGLKWATCNVGASKPEDFGDYFAWGEIKTKNSFSESGSLTYRKKKYSIEIAGNSQLDAARANWGRKWRLPTKSEMQELIDKCTWEWMTQNGVEGYKVIGPNGNSIFLPAAANRVNSVLISSNVIVHSLNLSKGQGYYWSSTPDEDCTKNAYNIYFYSNDHYITYNGRNYGQSVRPVLVDVKDLKAELEKTRKALAGALKRIERLKEKETGKPAPSQRKRQ